MAITTACPVSLVLPRITLTRHVRHDRGPEGWHIFDDPVIRIHIGSVDSRAAAIFIAANERKAFNRAVTVHLDEEWKRT